MLVILPADMGLLAKKERKALTNHAYVAGEPITAQLRLAQSEVSLANFRTI